MVNSKRSVYFYKPIYRYLHLYKKLAKNQMHKFRSNENQLTHVQAHHILASILSMNSTLFGSRMLRIIILQSVHGLGHSCQEPARVRKSARDKPACLQSHQEQSRQTTEAQWFITCPLTRPSLCGPPRTWGFSPIAPHLHTPYTLLFPATLTPLALSSARAPSTYQPLRASSTPFKCGPIPSG